MWNAFTIARQNSGIPCEGTTPPKWGLFVLLVMGTWRRTIYLVQSRTKTVRILQRYGKLLPCTCGWDQGEDCVRGNQIPEGSQWPYDITKNVSCAILATGTTKTQVGHRKYRIWSTHIKLEFYVKCLHHSKAKQWDTLWGYNGTQVGSYCVVGDRDMNENYFLVQSRTKTVRILQSYGKLLSCTCGLNQGEDCVRIVWDPGRVSMTLWCYKKCFSCYFSHRGH